MFDDVMNDVKFIVGILLLGLFYLIYNDLPPSDLPPGPKGIPFFGYLPFLSKYSPGFPT